MLTLKDHVAGSSVTIHAVNSPTDYATVRAFLSDPWSSLAWDTESTSYQGMYRPDWKMRLFQFGDAHTAFVIPVAYRDLIIEIIQGPRPWTAFNAPHDALTLDLGLGIESGILEHCTDLSLYSHLLDPRGPQEGNAHGGRGLKELSCYYIDPNANRWEQELKKAFKEIRVPIPGETYKSGKSKGEQKLRTINLWEGYRLIPTYDERYLRYSAMDVILTARLEPVLMDRLRETYGNR